MSFKISTYIVAFLLLPGYLCTAQEDNNNSLLKCYLKRNPKKQYITTLPITATIKTIDKSKYYVLVCEVNESVLVTQEYILRPKQAISSEDQKILDEYNFKMSLVNRDKKQDLDQKRLKKRSIYPLVFNDTVTYQLNNIKLIQFDREVSSKFSEYGSLGLFWVSNIIWASGILSLDKDDISTEKKQSIGLITIVGIIGSAASIKWILNTKYQNISPEKWYFRKE